MQLFGSINIAMFDWPWSGIHFMSGTLIGLIAAWWPPTRRRKVFWWLCIGILFLWEVYERTTQYLDVHHHEVIAGFKIAVNNFGFAPETKLNSFGDLVIGSVGLLVGRWVVLTIRRKLVT